MNPRLTSLCYIEKNERDFDGLTDFFSLKLRCRGEELVESKFE